MLLYKDGITIDIPVTEADRYKRLGYAELEAEPARKARQKAGEKVETEADVRKKEGE